MSEGSGTTWVMLADEAATQAWGARLARALPDDAQPTVLYLQGELGAGKTTLARGILHALGHQGAVRSPTYSLVSEYLPGGRRILHLDLFRLDAPDELLALGLADYLPGSFLWLIEWPERGAGAALPGADAVIRLEVVGDCRRAQLMPRSGRGHAWARELAEGSA